MDIEDEHLEERIINRRVHLSSGRVYNIKFKPPKVEGVDDVTGELLFHRNDDKPEILTNRLAAYKEQTEPILEYLKFKGIEVIKIDATLPTIEQVENVKKELKKVQKNKFK